MLVDDGGRALVAFGHEFMHVFIGRRAKWLESEVVDDQKRHAREIGMRLAKSPCPRAGERVVGGCV